MTYPGWRYDLPKWVSHPQSISRSFKPGDRCKDVFQEVAGSALKVEISGTSDRRVATGAAASVSLNQVRLGRCISVRSISDCLTRTY